MIGGERDRLAVTAENCAGVAAVGDDDLLRCDYCDYGCGSYGIALRCLKLAPANGS